MDYLDISPCPGRAAASAERSPAADANETAAIHTSYSGVFVRNPNDTPVASAITTATCNATHSKGWKLTDEAKLGSVRIMAMLARPSVVSAY